MSTSDGNGTWSQFVLVLDRENASIEFHLDDGQVLTGDVEHGTALDGTEWTLGWIDNVEGSASRSFPGVAIIDGSECPQVG
jgi:hypothetical protein